MLHFKFWQFWQFRRFSGYPPFLSTETLSEPYLGLISGGVTPTPSAPQIHPEYTLDTSFIAPPVHSGCNQVSERIQMSRPAGRDKKGGRDAISPCKYAACHDVTTDLQIFDCICIVLLHKALRTQPRCRIV